MPSIAEKIRDLIMQCGLEMSMFTDEVAQEAWEQGHLHWQKARQDVVGWLPQGSLVLG